MKLLSVITALLLVSMLIAEDRDHITQYGITWTFDKAYPAGQFITGDWWVVGPVTVVSVSPNQGPVDKDEYKAKANKFGDKLLKADLRMRNGSAIFPGKAGTQPYDSRGRNYGSECAVSYPLTLATNSSLISTVSHEMPGGQNLAHPIMWSSEKKVQCILKSGAVLTCLDKAPPADAFRPCFIGTTKEIFQEKDIQWDRLLNLEPAAGQPKWSELERYFERPWLDNLASWTIQVTGPSENNPIYGREFARITSLVGLALNCTGSKEEKRKTLIGIIQYGIDIHGFIQNGVKYMADGGHYSGRKFPVIFAGIMLDKKEFYTFADDMRFQEDQDTYYGTGWAGQTALWQMTTHHGPRRPYEEMPPEQWDKMDQRSEGYRTCCNGKAWIGTALAMRLISGIKIWNHDAYFDYCDRWMEKEDSYAAGRGKHKRPKAEGSAYDAFVTNMWEKYRASAPEQEYAGKHRKWQWTMVNGQAKAPGSWVENHKP